MRNRLAQQAFRRRRAQYIQELQHHIRLSDKPESTVIQELRQENSTLRNRLLTTQAKLQKLVSTMQTISDSMNAVTGKGFGSSCESGSEYGSTASPPTHGNDQLSPPTDDDDGLALHIPEVDFSSILESMNPCQDFIGFNWDFVSAQV